MAINANPARNAKHVAVCMMTGAGKGVALNTLGLVPSKFPVVIFDPHREYKTFAGRKVNQYKTRMNFAKQFKKAWGSGQPFVLAYTPDTSANDAKASKRKLQDAAEWFAQLVWKASDGNRILYAVFEEYGEYCDSIGDDETTIGKIWTGGRKFGIRGIAVFQRSATISKTIWGNSPVKVIGAQGYDNDIKRVMDALGCQKSDVIDLGVKNKKLEMFADKLDEMVRTQVHYLVSEAAGTFEKRKAYVKPAAYLRKKWDKTQKILAKEGGYVLAQ